MNITTGVRGFVAELGKAGRWSCLYRNTSKYGLNTFRYYGPNIWNSFHDDLEKASTIKTFVSQIGNMTSDTCDCYLCCTESQKI